MQGIHLRKYGVEAKIPFVLYEVDGVDLRVDAADGGSDCTVMKDEGAEATCTNDFVDEGNGYSITLTATEMQAARIVVYIIDSATKVWLDDALIIETYGHASAQHALDLDTALASQTIGTCTTNTDMVGTNSAALASVCTETRLAELDAANLPTDIAAIPTTAMRGTDSAALASVCTEARLAELAAANLPTDIAAIPTTAMRGTDSAALASVCTEARLAALTDWINGGRLDLLLDAIPTTAMRGTDSAALASVCTEARLAELAAANLPADIDAVKVVTDNLASSATTIVSGTVSHDNTAASTTVFYSDDITEATADHYKGRIVIFTSGALQNQASDITAYSLVSGEGKFTVTALTEAPADNVTFVIV